MGKSLKIELRDRVLWVGLNRPDKRNAFYPDMIEDLRESFGQPQRDKDLRALVLWGEGSSFCAGADLSWMKSMAEGSQDENQKDANRLFAMFEAGRLCPVPVLTLCHGHVFGGAIGLLAVSDFVVAEAGTQFCFSEVKWGLVPSVISPFVSLRMRRSGVKQMMLSGRRFTAEEARQFDLVDYIGDRADCDLQVQTFLSEVMSSAPQAVRETKLLLQAMDFSLGASSWNEVRKLTTETIARVRVSQEGQIGLHAFLKKTKPPWGS